MRGCPTSSCESAPFGTRPVAIDADIRRAFECCGTLLSGRGEVSGIDLATDALAAYQRLSGPSLNAFFDLLAGHFSPDPEIVRRCGAEYERDPSDANLRHLQRAVEPPRRELFRRLNLAPGGIAALIEMRRRLLCALDMNPAWTAIEADLEHLLRAWFNGGFLEFRRIDWRTPPAVLENLIKYEAVHHIRGWRELRRRLQADRRCFGFFHPALPDDPLIFTELALTSGLSAAVQPLLDPDSEVLDPAECDCVVFYSISNCHDGLRGVPFGNALIRCAVDSLRREFPRLRNFATLSPVPGFRAWLAGAALRGNRRSAEIVARLDESTWIGDAAQSAELERALMPLCAHYLLEAKRGQEPADPVARFHLGNGARLHRLNWMGDTSAPGLRRSAGLTANYLYRLSDIERNHQAYTTYNKVIASRQIRRLADESPQSL